MIPNNLYGVKGTLKILIVYLYVVGAIYLYISIMSPELNLLERNDNGLSLISSFNNFKITSRAFDFIMGLSFFFSGFVLNSKLERDSVKITRVVIAFHPFAFLIKNYVLVWFFLGMPYPWFSIGFKIGQCIPIIIASIFWISYLNNSVRVNKTYGLRNL